MPRLCSSCTLIIEEAFLHGSSCRTGHHHSFLDFKQAADEGCHLCTRLWNKIYDHEPSLLAIPPSQPPLNLEIQYFSSPATIRSTKQETPLGAIDINLTLKCEQGYTEVSLGEYCTVLPTKVIEQYLAPFAKPCTSSSRATIEQIRQWLSTCISSHKACCRFRTDELPTRLIVVEEKNDQLCARVCDSTELLPLSQYLTLSHIWGQVPILTLKKDNIQQLKQSIPIRDLPRVFQDAMWVTNELGYSYLWIDSLCIIQDSDGGADWLRECPRMNRVYCNSICNLAATGFESGQEGLFPTYQTDEILPPRFRGYSSGRAESHDGYCLVSASEWAVDVNRTPLHNRGWVFQEQIMAPRILHFTKKQVYWECYAAKASEVFPNGFPPYGMSMDNLKNKILVLSTLSKHSEKDALYREWLNLVQEYSRANLTYLEDKLPALSGLAKAFSDRLQDDYLAGLWRNDLIRGMLWHGTAQTKALATYRAPSWSWASVDGLFVCAELVGSKTNWKILAHILAAETTPLEVEDVAGQVVDGFIQISGPLREIFIEGNLEKHSYWFNFKSPFTPGTRDATTRQAIVYCCADHDLDALSIYPSISNWLPTNQVFLMPLLISQKASKNGCQAYGLALTPGNAHGEYTKVGTFYTSCHETMQGLFFEAHSIGERYYEQYDGKHHYTIRIL